jgi:hypothetical protein
LAPAGGSCLTTHLSEQITHGLDVSQLVDGPLCQRLQKLCLFNGKRKVKERGHYHLQTSRQKMAAYTQFEPVEPSRRDVLRA